MVKDEQMELGLEVHSSLRMVGPGAEEPSLGSGPELSKATRPRGARLRRVAGCPRGEQ